MEKRKTTRQQHAGQEVGKVGNELIRRSRGARRRPTLHNVSITGEEEECQFQSNTIYAKRDHKNLECNEVKEGKWGKDDAANIGNNNPTN